MAPPLSGAAMTKILTRIYEPDRTGAARRSACTAA
jgi:hypothetical protein